MINVNNSVLNTPGFRAAGWSSASTNHADVKRTHSPPIPTTAAVSSEYYRLAVRDANAARNELQGLGLEDGEDDEGGMVTGKSHVDLTGRRHPGRTGKKKSRRDRQQEAHRQAEEDDEDSSDLSDDSDEEVDNMQRWAIMIHTVCGVTF